MLVAAYIILLLLACLGLVKSTELVVAAIKQLARRGRVGAYGITAFILALTTSFPELFVGIMASITGAQSVVLGNVIGSNIADISIVIAIPAIMGGGLAIGGKSLKRDFGLVFVAGILPMLLLEDLTLSRSDGLIMIGVYAMFVTTILAKHVKEVGKGAMQESPVKRLLMALMATRARGDLGRFILGIAGLLVSSHLIVKLAEQVAVGMGLPLLVVGMFLVAFGTSLPELAFGIRSVLSRSAEMAVGNLLGSVVANATLILGISALIRPITLSARGHLPYMAATATFVVVYLLFAYFTVSRGKLSRTEAMILLMLYFGFVFWEVRG